MGTISVGLHFKVTLKKRIYLYVNSSTQWCQDKYNTRQMTPVVHLELRIFTQIFEKALMEYSGAWEKLINLKNLMSKISWHCPFKFNILLKNGLKL
jgi:hypothetical protein